MYLGLDKANFLSSTGQCKAFDQSADGYCRSEGCASFVLKRLSDAVDENDKILGMIKGVAVDQSGKTSSITPLSKSCDLSVAPFHPIEVLTVLRRKKFFSSRYYQKQTFILTTVEAHSTGTQAGDPNGLRSVRGVFAKGRRPANRLHVTSLKANIGHLEAASGGAGLAKLLLMLKHKQIPPQAFLRDLNSSIDKFGTDGTYIFTEILDWTAEGKKKKKRTAMLNNFGAAGNKGALLLQEYVEETPATPIDDKPIACLFGLSARSHSLLQQAREENALLP